MAVLTKTSLKTFYQTGDKPTQAHFEHLIDTMVAIPTAASYPAFLELEAGASATARPVGAVGRRLVETSATGQALEALALISAPGAVGNQILGAITTASARGHLAIAVAASAGAVGAIVYEAGTTASARNAIGLDGYASAGTIGGTLMGANTTVAGQQTLDLDKDSISGFILTPAARTYVIDQRARFRETIDWVAARVSAGHCAVALLTESSIAVASAAVDTTEVAASGTNTLNVGETLSLRVSDVSSADGLAFTIGLTRT